MTSYAALCARVCTQTWRRAHLLPPGHSPNSADEVLCGLTPAPDGRA